ncbi:site-specific integrase [Bacillus paramycoides]|uniref:site-specific integrase n=1 Tax=Bacillus paramycoides TaxID=2026194 RepID=UPI003828D6DC
MLSLLDLSNFIQLRDAVAVLVMFKTGIRINTLTQLEERHIDFNNNVLNLEGSIMKNHQQIKLPFDKQVEQGDIEIRYKDIVKKADFSLK